MDFRRTEKTKGAYFRQGMKHCIQAPGIGLFAAMSGFGAPRQGERPCRS